MSELIICDHFKWSLEDVRNLTVKEHIMVSKYFKKLERENKKASQKMKSRGRR